MVLRSVALLMTVFSLTLGSSAMQESAEGNPGGQESAFEAQMRFLREAGIEGDELIEMLQFQGDLEPEAEYGQELEEAFPEEEVPRDVDVILSKWTYGKEGKVFQVEPGIAHVMGLGGDDTLTFRSSDSLNNNCLFYSIIRDHNRDLLSQIMDSPDEAGLLLSPLEFQGRDFSDVRTRFLFHVYKNMKMEIPRVGEEPISVSDLLRSVMANDEEVKLQWLSKGEKLDTQRLTEEDINQYLGRLNESCQVLDETFAVIFSHIYKVPVYVLTPSTEAGTEGQLVQSPTTRYYKLPKLLEGQKPIMIYHNGLFGIHYSKLEVSEKL